MIDKKEPLIELINVYKDFEVGTGIERVLNDINLQIYDGEFVIIFGQSGSGKTTLLNTIMGLEPPTKGIVKYRGKNIYDLNDKEQADYRREHLGIVFQQSNFIKALNVAENVAYPLMLSGYSRKQAFNKAVDKLKQFDLHQFAKYTPTELSGGEQQRITIARALIGNPDLVVADEPTGNLDTKNGEKVMNIFKTANNPKCAVLMVTHNPSYDKYGTKLVYMADDVIVKIVDKSTEVIK